jgi:hypothetical protein
VSTATEVWLIPYDAPPPPLAGLSLVTPYWVYGRLPNRTQEDVIRSLKKHVAEVLDEIGGPWLTGYDSDADPRVSDSWEVRLWDEEGAFRFPFARVSLVGADTSTGPATYELVRQPVTIHLYPFPQPDTERALLEAMRLGAAMKDALRWGAARGAPLCVPLWDHHDLGLYQDSEVRQPHDFFRVENLTTDRMLDPEDDRYSMAIVSFVAQWRRAPNTVPGHLVESVRIAAHPE